MIGIYQMFCPRKYVFLNAIEYLDLFIFNQECFSPVPAIRVQIKTYFPRIPFHGISMPTLQNHSMVNDYRTPFGLNEKSRPSRFHSENLTHFGSSVAVQCSHQEQVVPQPPLAKRRVGCPFNCIAVSLQNPIHKHLTEPSRGEFEVIDVPKVYLNG